MCVTQLAQLPDIDSSSRDLTPARGTCASFKPCSPVPRAAVVQVGVIPARYKSGRFPGKPLVDIMGKPMVVRTWEQACKARTLDAVVVATDDDRIADVCRRAGARVVMTSEDCANGKDLRQRRLLAVLS